MDICIFLSGSITNGLDSPTAGEGRWGQNLAKMLALKGHHVDCVAAARHTSPPIWGNATPLDNVTLNYKIPNKMYDVALYIPWEHQYNNQNAPFEPCLTLPLRSKWFVHCTFSWGQSIVDDHTCYNNNHVLAYPYMQENAQFPPTSEEQPYRIFPLPIPIYTELPEVNIERRKDVIWSTKDVFHPDWGSVDHHVPRIGLATLKSIKRLSEQFEFDTHFLSTHYFNPANSWISEQLKVENLAHSIPNSYFYDLIPRERLMGIMSKVRITAIVSGLLGSFADSICQGAVPMCYSGHLYRESADKHGLKLPVFDATEEEIYDCMYRLYTDDDFYTEVIKDYRNELRYHSFDGAYKYFMDMVNELGI